MSNVVGTPWVVQDPHEIRVDEESKLTLHGLLQYYVKLTEKAWRWESEDQGGEGCQATLLSQTTEL